VPSQINLKIDDPRTAHRLEEATGYIELGMARHAIERLDEVSGNVAIDATADYLRGQALAMLGEFKMAADRFRASARRMPLPIAALVWKTTSQCYDAAGRPDLAEKSLVLARRARRAWRQVVRQSQNRGDSPR
jgi:tetratricopeptide (TPR) repeat protein